MTRMRTNKKINYFIMSNETAQKSTLSFEAIGLLAYCLSMPTDWEFIPKSIWKSRQSGKTGRIGRNAIYERFNELIREYHCIRIRKANPKSENLFGETEYEIFDDTEECKSRIAELENSEHFVEHAGNLKKCFRHPEIRDPETRDPENWDTIKETGGENTHVTKETTTQTPLNSDKSRPKAPSAVVVFSCLENLDILESLRIQVSRDYTHEEVEKAVERCLNWTSRPDDTVGLLTALKKKDEWNDNPSETQREEINQNYLKSIKHLDGKKYKETIIYIGTKYIEFTAGPKVNVVETKDKEFKKKVKEMFDFLGVKI